jgi:hypothetical protein
MDNRPDGCFGLQRMSDDGLTLKMSEGRIVGVALLRSSVVELQFGS